MKRFFNTFLSDMKRSMFSWTFFLAVFGIVLIKIPGLWTDLQHYQDLNVLYFYNYGLSEGIFNVYYLLCALPCASLFLRDWNRSYYRPLVIRTGKEVFGISKILTCIIVPICAIFLAEIIFVGALSLICPLIDPDRISGTYENLMTNGTFGPFLKNGFWPFFLVTSTLEALSGAFFTVCALYISTIIPNVFVVLAAPLLCQYYFSAFTGLFSPPTWLDISCVATGQFVFGDEKSSFLYGITFFTFLITVVGILFMRKFKRKMQNA